MPKLTMSLRRVTSVGLRYGLAVVPVAIALGLALLAQLQTVHNLELPLFLTAIAVTSLVCGGRAWCPGGCTLKPELQLLLHTAPVHSLHRTF